MQSNVNVVQSPQVATAQTSIVQSQQTPTLSTNEQTETQTPSQESFAVSLSVILFFIDFGKMCMFGTCFLVMDIILVFLNKILDSGFLYLLLGSQFSSLTFKLYTIFKCLWFEYFLVPLLVL